MNFEMFASRKLLTKYVEYYVDTIKRIQEERESPSYQPIKTINKKYQNISAIVVVHWMITEGMSFDEAYDKFEDSFKIEDALNKCLINEPYSEEELNHIYCNIYNIDESPYLDIAVRRFLFSLYNTHDVEEITKILRKENKWETMKNLYRYFVYAVY